MRRCYVETTRQSRQTDAKIFWAIHYKKGPIKLMEMKKQFMQIDFKKVPRGVIGNGCESDMNPETGRKLR